MYKDITKNTKKLVKQFQINLTNEDKNESKDILKSANTARN